MDVIAARGAIDVSNLKDGSLTASFKRIGKNKVTYSHRQRNPTETRCALALCPSPTPADSNQRPSAEIVRWVCESMRSFEIVNDRGFRDLMKTGRPEQYIPSSSMVSRDVKRVFARCRQHIATMLQVWHFSSHANEQG